MLACGIRNLGNFVCGILGLGIRNPSSTEKDLESSNCNPESTAWNPESKTVLDSLTWGEK